MMEQMHHPPRTESEILCSQARYDARKRREELWIGQLQEMPIFSLLVKRFLEGQSVSQVATWLYYLKPESPLENAAYRTIREHLTPLRNRVRAAIAARSAKESCDSISAPRPEEVIRAIQSSAPPDRPSKRNPVVRAVDKAPRDLSAVTALRYSLIQQASRIKEMMKIEEAQGCLLPRGYREMDEMRRLSAALMEYELGEEIMRKKALFNGLIRRPDRLIEPRGKEPPQ
jgi:hypothetical protein